MYSPPSLMVRMVPRPAPPLIAPHRFENLNQPQIDLTPIHVDAHDLHLDTVAELVDLLRVLAA